MSQVKFGAGGRETVSQYLRRTQGRNRHRLPYRKDLVKKPSRPARDNRTAEGWARRVRGWQLINAFAMLGISNE